MAGRAAGLPLLSALLYILATPPLDLELLGWVALAPLLMAVDRTATERGAFLAGLTGGMAASIGLYYWLVYTMVSYGGLSYLLSLPLFLLLALYLALYWGLFALLIKRLLRAGLSPLFTAPLLWTALEYLRTHLMTGFPWALLGYTQYKSVYLIQLSDHLGVYGVSFLLALTSALFYAGVRRYAASARLPIREALLFLIVIALPVLYGAVKAGRLASPPRGVRVALVQGNIDQAVKWDERFREETIRIYRELSLEAGRGGGDLIVWPETAVPFYFQQAGEMRQTVTGISVALNAPLFFGSPAYLYDGGKVRYLNSAYLLASGGVAGRYDKVHLVPFGEYVPLKSLLFFVEKITYGIGDFSAGKGPDLLVPPGDKGLSLAPLICYEAIFPDLVRQFISRGGNVLVNITNDAWYGRSSAPYQHLSAAVFRAVENGVFMLRAANTGITAIVDPLGRVEQATSLFERTYLTGEIYLPEGKTFYSRYGDLFAMTVSLLSFATALFAEVRLRRRKRTP